MTWNHYHHLCFRHSDQPIKERSATSLRNLHVLPAVWTLCQPHSSNSMHQFWYLWLRISLTSRWEVGLFHSTWKKLSSNLYWRNRALTLPISATTALFRISHSSRRSLRGLWLLVWRSICPNTICVRACNRHTKPGILLKLYWSEWRTIFWLAWTKTNVFCLCYCTSPQPLIRSIIQSFWESCNIASA